MSMHGRRSSGVIRIITCWLVHQPEPKVAGGTGTRPLGGPASAGAARFAAGRAPADASGLSPCVVAP